MKSYICIILIVFGIQLSCYQDSCADAFPFFGRKNKKKKDAKTKDSPSTPPTIPKSKEESSSNNTATPSDEPSTLALPPPTTGEATLSSAQTFDRSSMASLLVSCDNELAKSVVALTEQKEQTQRELDLAQQTVAKLEDDQKRCKEQTDVCNEQYKTKSSLFDLEVTAYKLHAEDEIEQAKTNASQYVVEIQNSASQQIFQIESEMAALRTAIQKEHEAIEQAKIELEINQTKKLEAIRMTLSEERQIILEEQKQHEAQLQEQMDEYKAQVNAETDEKFKAHNETLKEMEKQHKVELQKVTDQKERLLAQKQKEMDEIKVEHEEELDDLQSQHDKAEEEQEEKYQKMVQDKNAEIKGLKQKHEDTVEEYKAQIQNLTDTYKLSQEESEKQRRDELEKTKEASQRNILELEEKKEQVVAGLQAQIQTLELGKTSIEKDYDELNSQYNSKTQIIQDWETLYQQRSYCNLTHLSEDILGVSDFMAQTFEPTLIKIQPYWNTISTNYKTHIKQHIDNYIVRRSTASRENLISFMVKLISNNCPSAQTSLENFAKQKQGQKSNFVDIQPTLAILSDTLEHTCNKPVDTVTILLKAIVILLVIIFHRNILKFFLLLPVLPVYIMVRLRSSRKNNNDDDDDEDTENDDNQGKEETTTTTTNGRSESVRIVETTDATATRKDAISPKKKLVSQ